MEKFTNHAIIRSQQRGISFEVVQIILEYGTEYFVKGARILLMISKKQARKLKLPESVLNVAVIIEDSVLITVMHLTKRIPQKKESPLHRRSR